MTKYHVDKYSLGIRVCTSDNLILNEPLNGLDNGRAKDMRQFLLDLKEQGKPLLIVSHSAEDIGHALRYRLRDVQGKAGKGTLMQYHFLCKKRSAFIKDGA